MTQAFETLVMAATLAIAGTVTATSTTLKVDKVSHGRSAPELIPLAAWIPRVGTLLLLLAPSVMAPGPARPTAPPPQPSPPLKVMDIAAAESRPALLCIVSKATLHTLVGIT